MVLKSITCSSDILFLEVVCVLQVHSDHSSWFLPTAAAEVPQNPSLWDLILQLSDRGREGGRERGREGGEGGREGVQVLEREKEGESGRMGRERCIKWSRRTSVERKNKKGYKN